MINSTPTVDQVQTTYLNPPRNSSSIRSDNEFVDFLEKYYSLFLLIFGTVGNLLCLAVLSRETFRRSSAGIYLRFLTLSDLAAIYTGVLFFTARALFNNNFRKIDELSCKFHRWMSFTACDLSSWALVLVSTARLLSIAWPMKRLITRTRVYVSILVTIVVLLGANLPIFIIYGDVPDPVKNRTSLCVFTQDSYEDFYNYVFSWLVLVKFGFLPGVLLIVLNAALVLTVSRSGRAVDQVISGKSRPEVSSGPASRNLRKRLSVLEETKKDYSSKSTLDLESLELSTGSEVSDGTISSDRNEVTVTNKVNNHFVGVWSWILLHLKCKESVQPQGYRLKESSLRNLFCGIQMIWQGGELESQKDLVSLDEDVISSGHSKQETAGVEKKCNIVGKDTDLSRCDEAVNSGPENIDDLTSDNIPEQRCGSTEDVTIMADLPEGQKTPNVLYSCLDFHVKCRNCACTATCGSTSVPVGGEMSTDQTVSNQVDSLSRCSTLCTSHSISDDVNIQLQHDTNTTSQPTTILHTKFSSNNIWMLPEGQLCHSNIGPTQRGQLVIDNYPDNTTSLGLESMLKLNDTDNCSQGRDTEKHLTGKVDLSCGGHRHREKGKTRTSLRDRHCCHERNTSTDNCVTIQNTDIDMNINIEIPSCHACVNVGLESSHSCPRNSSHSCPHNSSHSCPHNSSHSSLHNGSQSCSHSCTHNGSQVDDNQRDEHPTCSHDFVCEYSVSDENCGNTNDITCAKGSNLASGSCVSCRDSPTTSGRRETTDAAFILASTCISHNDTTDTRPTGAVNIVEELRGSSTISQVEKFTEQPPITQVNKLADSPAISQQENITQPPVISEVHEMTESSTISQVQEMIESSTISQVQEMTESSTISQVHNLTESPAIKRRRGLRHKTALQTKVANKSRSLTRTLLVLNTVFLLCNTPITVYLTGKAYFWPDATEYSEAQEIIVTVANFSMYTSNSINFILYCVTGSRFRGQLVLMFKELYRFVGRCTRRLSRVYKQRG